MNTNGAAAGAAAANNNVTTKLIDKLFSFISQDIAIDDKIKSVTEKLKRLKRNMYAQIDDTVIRKEVTLRIEQQIANAKKFIALLINEYLFDKATNKFKLSCDERHDKVTFDGLDPKFNRIVLVDYENVRIGLTQDQRRVLHDGSSVVNHKPLNINKEDVEYYIETLISKDINALYILCKTDHRNRFTAFDRMSKNVIECNILFPLINSLHGINFNETDDYVMLTLLKLLVDKQHDMFPGMQMPVFVMSADNYDWFTPKNFKGELRARNLKYPYIVYYSPNTGGQWCYYRSANNNKRPGTNITLHNISEGRFYDVRTSLREYGYYNSDVFPNIESIDRFVSMERTSHPVNGDICSLHRKAKTAKAIPPLYKQLKIGSNIYEYKTLAGTPCTFNADTGEFNPDISVCNTWTQEALTRNVAPILNPLEHAQHLALNRQKQLQATDLAAHKAEQAKLLLYQRAQYEKQASENAKFNKLSGIEMCNITSDWNIMYNAILNVYNTRKKDTSGNLVKMIEIHLQNLKTIVNSETGQLLNIKPSYPDTYTDIKINLYKKIEKLINDLLFQLLYYPTFNVEHIIAMFIRDYYCPEAKAAEEVRAAEEAKAASAALASKKRLSLEEYMQRQRMQQKPPVNASLHKPPASKRRSSGAAGNINTINATTPNNAKQPPSKTRKNQNNISPQP